MAAKRKRNKRDTRARSSHWLREPGAERVGSDHYLLTPPIASEVSCPDCGAHWSAAGAQARGGAGSLDHADGCPIASGYAAAADDDAEWFDAHPDATVRRRPPVMAEVQTVLLMSGRTLPDMPNGVRYAPGGEVVVTQLTPRMRRRDFRGVLMLADVGPSS